MLARTAVKKAYALGHIAGGLGKWRYVSVADERTRPRHLALHGKVFEVGSEEEQLALKVMGEPHCRCRPIPFFDDPKRDAPEEEYEQEKRKWAKQTYEEWKIDKNIAYIAKANPQSREELLNLTSDLENRFKNKNYRILGHILGLKAQQMAEDIVKTLDENFFYSKKMGCYTFVHIYKDHSVKESFKLSDVLKIRKEGKRIGEAKDSLHIVGELKDGRKIHIAISKKNLKIITAHIVNERYLRNLLRTVKEVEYDYQAQQNKH